jgi:biotin synthase
MVAPTRIMMPETQIRLSAGRMNMSREDQAMYFFAGDKLLTTPNPDVEEDMKMFEMLDLILKNRLLKFLSPPVLKQVILNFYL